MIRVLLADDHRIFREGLKALLANISDIELIKECADGHEVLAALKAHPTDVAVLDINMPGVDGLEVTRQMREHHSEVKVLILSMHHEPHFIQTAIETGANGYLLKNTGGEEFCEAIRTVARGETYLSSEVTTTLIKGLQKKDKKVLTSRQADLSARELEVLRLIAKEYTTPQIADALFISAHTVKSHRKNLLSKLQVKNAAGLIRFAVENELLE